VAALDILFCQPGIHHAVEPANVITQVLEDATDNPVAAAVDLDPDLGAVFRIGVGEIIDRGGTVFKRDAARGYFVEVGLVEGFVEGDVIDLPDLVAGMREFLREVAVVGKQQHPRRVAVQPADGKDAFGRGVPDQIDDGPAALGIVGRCYIVLWFVEEDINEVMRDRYLFAPHLDGVGGVDFGAGLRDELAVDGHLALADEFRCVAAGADAAVRNKFVKRHGFTGRGRGPGGGRVSARAGWSRDGAGWVRGGEGWVRDGAGWSRGGEGWVRDGAGLAAVFEVFPDGLFPLFLGGLFLLAQLLLYGAVAFLIIEFAEIVGLAFPESGTLPAGGMLFHDCEFAVLQQY